MLNNVSAQGGYGGHRSSSSSSGATILAAFIPTAVTAVIYLAIFVAIRNKNRKSYAARTFLGTIPEKERTPASRPKGGHWFQDFRTLSDEYVLQHNSLDGYLYLRFLRFIIGVCLLGCVITWPILMPINATGGGDASQLDRISFSNIKKNSHLWAHVAVAWVFFLTTIALIARERLRLIGTRQAYYINDEYAARLSSRTVLFMHVPREACQPENLEKYFGDAAERSWPVKDTGNLEGLIQQRNNSAYALESAEFDLAVAGIKHKHRGGGASNGASTEAQEAVPKPQRPTQRQLPVIGKPVDPVETSRNDVVDLAAKVAARRAAPSRNVPEHSAIFVSYSSQAAAHRAFQQISFQPKVPTRDRFLAVLPKEVLWKNLALPTTTRLSKASLGLAFVIAFTIFFSIPVGIIGTISNIQYLADRFSWLSWVENLPPSVLGLITGLLPPYLVSYFVSYVPKLFRHIAKLSGEPTIPQAELKTQAHFFFFQVAQVFLVTTFSSGAAAVFAQIAQHPEQAPDLLASSLPKASNFYLTYFILQGTASAASNILNYSDLFEYLFYEHYWDKTPREKFQTYAQMKGTPWYAVSTLLCRTLLTNPRGSWYPKFTNFLVIAIVYSCIAPLTLGFAAAGITLYYLSYRYNMLYIYQTKVDTKGEAYKRALKQMPTGVYLAELCLIGLMSARKAKVQTALMVTLLVLTAVINLVLDRMLKPLELYLGVDIWQEQEVPLLADEDDIDPNDEAALHAASHSRRLGMMPLPKPARYFLSDFFDGFISLARNEVEGYLSDPAANRGDDAQPLKGDELEKAYTDPAMTSKTPKLWIPRDPNGVSKQEIELNEAAGIPTTDEAAELDEDGKLHWDHDFDHVPVFKKPIKV